MLNRQKILIKIIANSGGKCTRLQLAKLSFLLSVEGRSDQLKTFYEFVPYKFGPYSFGLAHELDGLKRDGYIIDEDENVLSLTEHGKRSSNQQLELRLLRDIELLQQHYGGLTQSSLVDTVYANHPWYTSNCIPMKNRRASIGKADPANFTVGYQGFQIDGLLNALLEAGIKLLVDTRSNPVSRRFGYHKTRLSRLCELVGLEYRHLPELGVPSSWRQDISTPEQYETLFERYKREVLARQKDLLIQTANEISSHPSALFCREESAEHCHRKPLAAKLSAINNLPIVNISSLKKQSTQEKEPAIRLKSILLK